jgi:hypothetical protein
MNPEDENILNQSDKLQIDSLIEENTKLRISQAGVVRSSENLSKRLTSVLRLLNSLINEDTLDSIYPDNELLVAARDLIELIAEGIE